MRRWCGEEGGGRGPGRENDGGREGGGTPAGISARSRWPTEEECLDALKRAGCTGEVLAHCRMTQRIALAIARRIRERGGGVDLGLVSAGALLHDIGRARTHGIRHGVEGAEIARAIGLPGELVRIIERHLGAGIERDEAARLGLPPRDYIPETLEEKIVAHADNLAGEEGKVPLLKVLEELGRRGLERMIPRMEALHRELSALCGADIDELRV
ncbi:MAG: TIGR00295 family protein [Thermoplasmata archaeon]